MTSTENKQITTTSAPADDERMPLILDWIATLTDFSLLADTLRPASADASFRRYFRINDSNGGTFILMDAPPPQEDVRPFIQVAELFGATGVTVPLIYASQTEQGFLLLSDLGTTMYSHLLNQDSAQQLYMDAINSLVQIQLHSQPETLPEYDRATQMKELQLFPEWFIKQHLGATLTPAQQTSLDKVFEGAFFTFSRFIDGQESIDG